MSSTFPPATPRKAIERFAFETDEQYAARCKHLAIAREWGIGAVNVHAASVATMNRARRGSRRH